MRRVSVFFDEVSQLSSARYAASSRELMEVLANALPWTGCWQMPFPGQVAGKCPSLDRLLSNALPWTVAVKCPSLDRLMANALPWTGCCQKPFPGQVSGKCPSLDSNRREKCPQVNTLPNHAFDFSTRLDLRREFKNGPLILLVK